MPFVSGRRAQVVIPIVLAGLSMLGPFSIDTPFPAFPQMRTDFGATSGQMQWVVSAYLFAFGAMSLFHGPISDALGRKPVIIYGVGAYAVASLAAAFAPNLAFLLACRVIQGACAGGGVVVSRTVIRDLFEGATAQRLMSRVAMIFGLAPAVAPIIGGLLLRIAPWRGIFLFMALFALVMIAAVVLLLPETHPRERRTPLRLRDLLRSLAEVARDGSYQRIAGMTALAGAAWFVYVGGAAILMSDLLGRGETDYWMLFVPLISGVILGSWISGRAAGRIGGRALVAGGFALALVGGLVNLAITSVTDAFPYVVVGPAVMSLGFSIGFPTTQLAMLDLFPRNRGSAASLSTFLMLTLNSVIAALVVPLVSQSVRHLAAASLTLIVAGVLVGGLHLALSRRPWRTPPDQHDLPATT